MRYRTRLLIFKNKYNKNRRHIKVTLSKSGRNLTGKQTVFNRKFRVKTKTPVFNFKVPFMSRFFFLKWINLNKKITKKYNVLSTWDNTLFCLPNILGSTVGLHFHIYGKLIKNYSILRFGIPCFLSRIPDFFKICNIFDKNQTKPTYAAASGSFCTKIPKKKRDKLLKIVLPSKIIKYFKSDYLCFVGRNDLSSKKLLKPGKAGYNYNIGIKSSVRGVAMNPVDHPNGGRTKSCSPEKSPWGWIAKLNK